MVVLDSLQYGINGNFLAKKAGDKIYRLFADYGTQQEHPVFEHKRPVVITPVVREMVVTRCGNADNEMVGAAPDEWV